MPLLRRLLLAAAVAPVVATALLLVAGLEGAPAVATAAAPTPEDARRARDLLERARAMAAAPGPDATLVLSAADLSGLAAVAGRFLPGVRLEATIVAGGVVGRLSAPAPLTGGRLWWNLSARAPAPAPGLALAELRFGAAMLPATPALAWAAAAADLALEGRPARAALAAIEGVSVDDGALALRIALTDETRRALAGAGGEAWRRLADVDAGVVERALAGIAAGPREGPFALLLADVLRRAADGRLDGDDPTASRRLAGGMVALGAACGERRLIEIVSPALDRASRVSHSACWHVMLDGRRDLRQHFALSAAFVAVGREAQAFALGELKELLDAAPGGSGFSFDDLAADRAGMRFARAALAGGPADWRAAADLLDAGATILPPLDGLAAGLSAEAFASAYGDLDDPRYAALVDEIDRRLDALPLYAPGRAAEAR